ncbi:LysM peptidoglycan-binding domain-containing protein [Tissierella sp. MSJ-40]|uniref:LysM peptidoglycan-binding domain-containing protein n=1 Tax=Tissierella simiarum TaxID=2841534 RepID=A0ABS6E968_9FIRM|nr:LysM peptidoglycan-binding domain-containing protein [Tissierella simiarum]MBU5438758.1 LysM peptidoglycan-binding domain-containing protein [Tissierella simiarum]
MYDYNEMDSKCPTGSFSYTIKSGDTLYKLARMHNTTVEAITAINPGINPNNLQVGQRICIPKGTTPPTQTCPTGTFSYTIKSGDTLYKLAMTYNTTVEAIMAVNPGIDPNNLQIGQRICIPRGTMPPPTSTCPTGTFSYTIRSGDTFYLLAIRYNTTVEAIMAANPGVDPNNLQIGQRICIPGRVPPTPTCPTGTFSYTIRSGDTFYLLAIRYNTTVEAIMAVNPGVDPNNLQIGQRICIPGRVPPTPTCPTGTFSYTIRPGDTLYQLAIRYNTTVEAIMAVNPGIDPNNLQIGQRICIPGRVPPTPTCPTGTFSYTIRPGDTLYQLAIRYNTTVEAIMAVNPGIDPNNLRIGQRICIPERVPPTPTCDGFFYRVRPGDTFYSIAQMFNISVDRLLAANPHIDPNNLMVGQLICIPRTTMPPITCPGGTVYVVRPNDTLSSIAMRFNVSIMDLMAANPNINWCSLMPGQQICIPRHMPCSAETTSSSAETTPIQ